MQPLSALASYIDVASERCFTPLSRGAQGMRKALDHYLSKCENARKKTKTLSSPAFISLDDDAAEAVAIFDDSAILHFHTCIDSGKRTLQSHTFRCSCSYLVVCTAITRGLRLLPSTLLTPTLSTLTVS